MIQRKATASLMVAAAVALLVGGAVAAGGNVWVSQTVERHGGEDLLVTEGAVVFDLSDLADGETRIFGSGPRQVTAVRDGDVVAVSRDAGPGAKALSMSCQLERDTCQVMTSGDDGEQVAIILEQTRELAGCDDSQGGEEERIHVIGGPRVQKLIAVTTGDGDGREVVIGPDFVHRGAGATEHDLGELLDGETRIFGNGVKQITAVREGDTVNLTIEKSDADSPVELSCRPDTDTCQVITFDDAPDQTMVMIQKTRSCSGGQGECDHELIELMHLDGKHRGHTVDVFVHEGEGSPHRRHERRKKAERGDDVY